MGIVGVVLAVWAVAMIAWFAVSKYFKSADVDKIKQRLTGPSKARAKAKGDKTEPQSVMQTEKTSQNKLAVLLVEKYRLGPKILIFLEQAGLRWSPARLVHLKPGGVCRRIRSGLGDAADGCAGVADRRWPRAQVPSSTCGSCGAAG